MRRVPGFYLKLVALSFTFSFLVVSIGVAQEDPPDEAGAPTDLLVVRVFFANDAERDRLAAELGALEEGTRAGYLTVLADRATFRDLRARGLRVEVDRAATRRVNEHTTPPFRVPPRAPSTSTVFDGYKTVEEVYAYLDAKVAANPTRARKVDLGDSWCKRRPGACTQPAPSSGYDLFALQITNQAIPGPKPAFWFDAGIHSREIATPEVALRFIDWLLDNYATNADAHWLVDWHDLWVMPVLNPDGHHIVAAGADAPYSQRKNADQDDGCSVFPPTATNQFGTDLNRNFPFLWGAAGGSSGSPCTQTYRGPSAASEEETQAVATTIRSLIADQRGPSTTNAAPITATGIVQSLHSHGNLNLYPWGWTRNPAPNGTDLRNIAAHMSARSAGGNGYRYCQPASCLYAVDGDTTSWAYGERGIPAYTTELEGGTFFPAYAQIDAAIWPNNRGMLVYLAKIARTPYLLTRGPDANSVAASPAAVAQDAQVNLTASLNYAWTGNAYRQNVAGAEYYLDTPPWAGGVAQPMTPTDSAFNSPTEAVRATLPTTALPPGRHILFVRGRGVNSYQGFQSWGPVSATFLDVLPPAPAP